MRVAPFILSVVLAAVPAIASAQAPGATAPAFRLTDTSGKSVQLADYRGKFVVLEWTNPECPFVRKHYASGNMLCGLLTPDSGEGTCLGFDIKTQSWEIKRRAGYMP